MNKVIAVLSPNGILRQLDKASGNWEYPALSQQVSRAPGQFIIDRAILPYTLDPKTLKSFVIDEDVLTLDVVLALMCNGE